MGGELKSEKCFWTIQENKWKAGIYKLEKDMEFEIIINKDRVRTPIKYIPPQESRRLVGVEVNPIHNTRSIELMFENKISQYIARLYTCKLALMMIL